ncbi:MAG: 5-methyltetrahydropteroyltriglutamate--homocysteine methyltransferase, partial [Chloroflexi bacterium]|nr:5-methyltetrahydropteroyltriglutamate--homocysteine methyltransferase [Chloroflexota bacterium]
MHGIPKEVQRVCHICCGYPNSLDSEGYKKADLDAYDRIASLVDDSTIDEVSLEDSHRHNDLNLLEKFTKTK